MAAIDKVKRTLMVLQDGTPDVQGCAVVDLEGFAIATQLNQDQDEDTVAALSAMLLGPAQSVVEQLDRGEFSRITIQASKGSIVITGCGSAVLLALTAPKAKLGLVYLQTSKAAAEIADALG